MSNRRLLPLAGDRFSAACFFNSAMIGLESTEAEDAAGSPQDWNEAVVRVQSEAASLLGVAESEITVFHNTTAAVERVIQRVCQELHYSSATLLTSDLEYPGIIAHLDEAWPGRVAFARVSKFLWRGEAELIEARLREAVLLTRPSVVYLSHIARSSGYRLPEDFFDFIREVSPRTVIIVDGAQAVGNIQVSADLLRKVSFYVTSGHKWLCGRPALGLVYAAQEWAVADPAQGYSKLSGSGGTGSLDALGSLGRALADFNGASGKSSSKSEARMKKIEIHNMKLARLLCEELLPDVGAKNILAKHNGSAWKLNGIVTLTLGGTRLSDYLTERDIVHTLLQQEPLRTSEGRHNHAPRYDIEFDLGSFDRYDVNVKLCRFHNLVSAVPPGGCIRLSLHYFHGTTEVVNLADIIKQFVRQPSPSRSGDPRAQESPRRRST